MEVCNTDAEGRLILADAMAYVQKKYELESMVDRLLQWERLKS